MLKINETQRLTSPENEFPDPTAPKKDEIVFLRMRDTPFHFFRHRRHGDSIFFSACGDPGELNKQGQKERKR